MSETRLPARGPLSARAALLVEYLGVARYATTDQVRHLLADRRDRKVVVRWLSRLCSEVPQPGGGSHLRRLEYRRLDGAPVPVWALGSLGRTVASEIDPGLRFTGSRDVGHQFLAHTLLLNDVLLDLVLAFRASGPRRLAELPFRWQCEDRTSMQFEMFQRHLGITASAALRPDAVLTFPQRRRRLFLEAETGTQSVSTANPQRGGAIQSKLERYVAFFLGCGEGDGQTWYHRAFPDGFAPRLLFLVHSEARRARVRRALEEWHRAVAPERFRVVVFTFAEAASEVAAYLPAAPAPAGAARPGEERVVRIDRWKARNLAAAFSALSRALEASLRGLPEHDAAAPCRLSLPPLQASERRALEEFLDREFPHMPGR